MSSPTLAAYPQTVNAAHVVGAQDNPAATALNATTQYGGAALVTVWADEASGVIRLQVGQAGYPVLLQDDFVIPSHGGALRGEPTLAALPDGSFVAVWGEANGSNGTSIFRQHLAYDGTTGTVTTVGKADLLAQPSGTVHGDVIALADGGTAVAYAADGSVTIVATDATGATHSGVVVADAVAGGHVSFANVGSSLAVGYETSNGSRIGFVDPATFTQTASIAIAGTHPEISKLSDGRVVLVTTDHALTHVNLLDGHGNLQGGFDLSNADGGHANATVLGLSDGGFLVGWTSIQSDGSPSAVMGQRFDGTGAADGDAFHLGSASPTGGEDHVVLYATGSSSFSAAYDTHGAAGDPDLGIASTAFTYSPTILGTQGNDVIEGTSSGETISGLGGNDVIHGNGGPDVIDGGAGNDEIWAVRPGATGTDRVEIHGGDGDDVIHGNDGQNVVWGDAGNDTIYGGAGQDEIHVGPGHDVVSAGGEDDIIYLRPDGTADAVDGGGDGYYGDLLALDLTGSKTGQVVDGTSGSLALSDGTTVTNVERLDITGTTGDDRLIGFDQRDGSYSGDTFRAGAGNDYLDGRAGDDWLDGGAGRNTLIGGTGDDTLVVRAGSTGTADGGDGKDTLRLDAVNDDGSISDVAIVGDLSGTSGSLSNGLVVSNVEAVLVSGSNVADDLRTGAGDDFIRGNGGNDHFSTGAGADWIDGGAGADVIDAGAGDDTIVVTGGEGGDTIDGGAGNDLLQLNFYDSVVPLVVNVSGNTITMGDGTTAVNIEKVEIHASNLDDVINTGASNDVISGRDGNDTIDSGAGNDIVNGGTGDNTIRLGDGDDTAVVYVDTGSNKVDGGAGTDTVEVRTLDIDGSITLDMRAGTLGTGTIQNVEKAVVYGSNGKVDVVTLDGADLVYGSNQDDRLVTNGGNDTIYAGGGNDYIDAGTGFDTVSAGSGDDTVSIHGNTDVDGEDGNDTAVYEGKRSDYDAARSSTGTIVITDNVTHTTATFRNVESFRFKDGTVAAADIDKAPVAPVAVADVPAEVSEDAVSVTGSLTANDTFSTSVMASLVGSSGLVQALDGHYGKMTVASDNTFTYVPGASAQALKAGDHVTDVFTYRLTDGAGLTSDATVTIALAGVNDAPVAATAAESFKGSEDTTLKGALLKGTDAEGSALSFAMVQGSNTHGSVVLDAATGAFTFTPDKDFNGAATFSYVVSDGSLSSQPKTVLLDLAAVNDAPVASVAPETANGTEDVVLRGKLAAGSDVDGDALTYALAANSAKHGTVVVDAAGTYAFTPDKDWNGAAEFAYTVSDGKLLSAPKTVSLTLAAVNDAPVASATVEMAKGAEDTVITGRVAAGSDVDGDALTYTLVDGSAMNGTVRLEPTGAYAFTPGKDFNGAAQFSYVVSDGSLSSAPKVVSLTVTPVNDAPVASATAEMAHGPQDVVLKGTLLKGVDVDGDALTYAVVANSSHHGSVSLDAASGAYAFTPEAGYVGPADFSYVVSDGSLTSVAKTVSLTLDPVNHAPTTATAAETAKGTEDVVLKGTLLKGVDVDGNALTYGLVAGSAKHGSVVVDGATGAYAFTADKDYNGAAEFAYTVSDGKLASAPKTVGLTFAAVNDAPVASTAPETAKGTEDTILHGKVLAASDVDGDALTYKLLAGSVTHGSVVLNADGNFDFTPDKDWNGPASFGYVASDGTLSSGQKTFSLTFDAVNDAPVVAAGTESFHLNEDTILKGMLLRASDVDGDALSYQLVAGSATHGTATVDAASGAFSFAPAADYNGTAEFRYKVFDGHAFSAEKTVGLTVDAANDAPVAKDDAGFTVDAGKALTIQAGSLLANDIDVDGDKLTIAGVSNAVGGTVALNADGSLGFTASNGFSGAGGFTYSVTDGHGGSSTAKVGIAVNAASSLPVINGTDRADIIFGTDKAEAINGKGGNDVIHAGSGGDVVHGGDGADIIFGGSGQDKLFGDAGNDVIFAGSGKNVINGGLGDDVLTGGLGADTFVFDKLSGKDTVINFKAGPRGGDILDVSALGFHNFEEVKAASHEVKLFGIPLATVIEAHDGTTVSLALVKMADLHASDFLFG